MQPRCAVIRLLRRIAFLPGLLCLLPLDAASQLPSTVKPGTVTVSGKSCVGQDCFNGEVFPEDVILRLKENNTRVGFWNTDAAVAFGNNWVLEANDSSNEGPEEFRWKAQSLEKDSVKRSNGRNRGIDCVLGQTYESQNQFDSGLPVIDVPLGDTINIAILVDIVDTEAGRIYVFECQTTPWFTEYEALRIATGADPEDDIVTLGYNSQPVAGVVTVGGASVARTIKHVGTPVAGSDMLPAGLLTMYPEKKAKILELRKTIALLSDQLAALENADADGDGVANRDDTFPRDPTESADSDGDGVGDNADDLPYDPTETRDSDGDGVGDNREAELGTGIDVPDSDGDGYLDGEELDSETDPLDPRDFPSSGLNIPLIWKAIEE